MFVAAQVRNITGTTATQGAINTDFVGLELNAQAFIGAAASGAPMHFHQVRYWLAVAFYCAAPLLRFFSAAFCLLR